MPVKSIPLETILGSPRKAKLLDELARQLAESWARQAKEDPIIKAIRDRNKEELHLDPKILNSERLARQAASMVGQDEKGFGRATPVDAMQRLKTFPKDLFIYQEQVRLKRWGKFGTKVWFFDRERFWPNRILMCPFIFGADGKLTLESVRRQNLAEEVIVSTHAIERLFQRLRTNNHQEALRELIPVLAYPLADEDRQEWEVKTKHGVCHCTRGLPSVDMKAEEERIGREMTSEEVETAMKFYARTLPVVIKTFIENNWTPNPTMKGRRQDDRA